MNELTKLGDGFIVWERSVDGDWQIWTRPLAGDGQEKRLVPAEEERFHFCPKISPDGTKLAYLSYRAPIDAYEGEESAVLYLMDIASGQQTKIFSKALSYREDRAVVWLDNERLSYIQQGVGTVELNLRTGKTIALINDKPKDIGWLVNTAKTHATTGRPQFSEYNAKTGAVSERPVQGGCQPYFTQDGKWGFWVNAVGGPITRMFLPTRDISSFLEKGDQRLPKERGYLYFPMISPCMRFFAVGTSLYDHDHFASDYDIFVSRINPFTLDLIGKPVRYTNFKGCDRFPDVWCAPLPLGSYFVEGPTKLTLTPPIVKTMHWKVNEASLEDGRTLEHFFKETGDHWLLSWNGKNVFRGLVHVSAPKPPVLRRVSRVNESQIELVFDEPISLDSARAMAGTTKLKWIGLDDDNHTATLEVPANLKDLQEVMVSGVRDKAQSPNEMPPTRAEIIVSTWPITGEPLVYAWDNKIASAEAVQPTARGKVFWSHSGGMDVRGGYYRLPKAGNAMMGACSKSGAFTIEAIIKSHAVPNDKETRPIFSLEDLDGDCRIALVQQTNRLLLRLATDASGGLCDLIPLCDFSPAHSNHLVVGYEKGRILLALNGTEIPVESKLTGRVALTGNKGLLRVGACSKYESTPWPGTLDQLSIYNRLLTTAETAILYGTAQKKITERAKIKPLRVTARLIKASRAPTLEEVKPYAEGLVKNQYEVLPKEDGDAAQDIPAGTRIIVSHWVWMNTERAVAQPAEVGKTYRFTLEPLEAHNEIKPLVRKSDIEDDFSSEEYLDISNW